MKEEEPFNVSYDRFESGEEEDVIAQAEFVEPSSKVDGLVLDTSRTKKQKEARQSSKVDEEEDTGGNIPTGKAKEQRNPRSEYFREDVYFLMKNRCVIVKSSLKETHDLLHGNKAKTIKDPVPIVEELKKMLPEYVEKRAGFLAQFTSSAGDTPRSSLDRSPKRHPFVLDEASDDDEGIVSLESDGEPFDTSH
ncbi:hypothetical protein R1sor_019242 [Riccia sorocarpa]|uniref:Uncharacterized protein n=1 Tax=Riccia sorocarpa TaxID=122646 RepID=A0ABD3IBZ1_9MARC